MISDVNERSPAHPEIESYVEVRDVRRDKGSEVGEADVSGIGDIHGGLCTSS